MPQTSSDSGREAPPASCFTGPLVTVFVGKDKQKFYAHHRLLTHYSEFFQARLDGSWPKDQQPEVTLEDEFPQVYHYYNHWMYTGEIPIVSQAAVFKASIVETECLDYLQSDDESSNSSHKDEAQPKVPTRDPATSEPMSQEELALLWIQANFTRTAQLKNNCLDALVKTLDREGGVSQRLPIRYIYQNTDNESGLRRLLIDALVFSQSLGDIPRRGHRAWPEDLLQDIIQKQSSMLSGLAPHICRNEWAQLKASDFHD